MRVSTVLTALATVLTPAWITAPIAALPWAHVGVTCIPHHSLFSYSRPGHYSTDCAALGVCRLTRFLAVLMVPVAARTTIRASGTASLAAFFEQRPAFLERKVEEVLGGALFSFKHVLMFSGATALLSQAVHTTLPLAGQLAFHCCNTLALVAFHTAPLVHVMRAVAFSGDYRSICTFLNALLALAQVDIEHSAGGPGLPHVTCDLLA
jgi:hypothetical protein